MRRFKKLLFFMGESERSSHAMQVALDLQKRNGASLKMISVIEEDIFSGKGNESAYDSIVEVVKKEKEKEIRELASSLGGDDSDFQIEVLIGTNFLEITKLVLKEGHDLVIKPAAGKKGPIRSFLFGTTAMHLFRKCPCPVWVVKQSPLPGTSKILVAVAARDGSESETYTQLDTKLIELGSSLAERYECEWDLVHAWRLFGESMLRSGRVQTSSSEVQAFLREEQHDADRRLQALLSSVDNISPPNEIHLVKGYASDVIPETARSLAVDLLIMGTVGRTGVSGLFISNTAEQVLSQLDCSVLAVKPDGFVSPVSI
jgi:nucleotide-binding universal stress UspA family protein